MKDLSLHLLDLIENSANAGAGQVVLLFDWNDTVLSITLTDNGPGLPEAIKKDPANPFTTTRTTRPVGFGLNLFREAAEQTGGNLIIGDSDSGGILLKGDFHMDHIDAKPLGDIIETILAAITAWVDLDLEINVGQENILSTIQLKAELGEIELTQPEIRDFIFTALKNGFMPLTKWLTQVSLNLS
jgi:Histidine kinase-, DNA gyrase B-, and HSP90-like ATPase